VLLFAALLWLTRHPPLPVVAVYTPPAALRPAEAGVVIDGRVDTRDLVAGVVDLAIRGYVALAPMENAGRRDVLVSVQRPWLHDRDIRTFETVLLAHVFTDGARQVRLSELRARGYPHASIKEAISDDLEARGLFAAAPRAVRRVGRGLAVGVVAAWAQLAWNAHAGGMTYLAGLVTGAALWWLADVVAAGWLTAEGRRTRQALEGLREYLARVERRRLDGLAPGTLDEQLPWAVALGVTEGWLLL
jgi:hypothetical protein